jgi:hypothetical protein
LTDRDRKLAELAELATGIRWGMAAFDERADEMGPGPSARGNGPGAKGQHSSPVEGQLERPPTVVTPAEFDRRLARAHAAVLDLEAAYGEIARTQRGIPSKGEPSCAWCAEAVQASEKTAAELLAKARAKGNKTVKFEDLLPIPLNYRSRTYLYAEERKGERVVGKALVCEWCIGKDSLVTTARGGVPIQEVTPDDRVLTRLGYRQVQHVTLMGHKRVMNVRLASGQRLTCTPDHRVATPSGWVEAALLSPSSRVLTQADAAMPPTVRAGVGVDGVVGMTLRTLGAARPSVVMAMVGRSAFLETADRHAQADAALMVDLHAGRNGSEPCAPHSSMDCLLPVGAAVHRSVAAVLAGGSLPDAMDPLLDRAAHESFVESRVVDVTHGAIVPVYDIGVEDAHEFVAEGVLVHNCYRFSRREGRKPTIEERWVHAQGGRMPKKPVPPRLRVKVR